MPGIEKKPSSGNSQRVRHYPQIQGQHPAQHPSRDFGELCWHGGAEFSGLIGWSGAVIAHLPLSSGGSAGELGLLTFPGCGLQLQIWNVEAQRILRELSAV